MSRAGRTDAGFSLAEVVVALGILAGVLISVAGLLVLGNRLVGAGRHGTTALSVARDVLEEIGAWGFEQTLSVLACPTTEPVCSVNFAQPESVVWKERVERVLPSGDVAVLLEAAGAPSLGEAEAVRVTVILTWKEELRTRRLALATVRT
jgi:hypothetical protein